MVDLPPDQVRRERRFFFLLVGGLIGIPLTVVLVVVFGSWISHRLNPTPIDRLNRQAGSVTRLLRRDPTHCHAVQDAYAHLEDRIEYEGVPDPKMLDVLQAEVDRITADGVVDGAEADGLVVLIGAQTPP